MSAEQHARARELFLAVAKRSPEDREILLDEACGDDDELRREVESLLEFAGDSTLEEMPRLLTDTALAQPLTRVGNYRILQKLGEGGMGEVYEAEQEQPVHRRVALKLIKWGMDTKQVIARFESERQALALMNHANIARVFEAGATEGGRPYFAMECVRGVAVTEYCDTHRLTTSDRLRLFMQICDGVQHAHQRGIIHRDIKPSNVLVTVEESEPVPKIIDFGVAKATAHRLTERTVYTELGQWIGTPGYMSPEQAEMTGLDVDTRTDVYSLGVLLYELLVGALILDSDELRSAGLDEIRRRIREDEPTKPSTRVSQLADSERVSAARSTDPLTLGRQLRGDLDWITMKALEKDRTRRYASPSELAADIRRHLANEPVLASPPNTLYRVGKFARRHRVAVTAVSLVLIALVIGVAGTTVGLLRAQRAERAAQQEVEFLVGIFEALDPGDPRGGGGTAADLLARGAEGIDEELAGQPLVQARLKDTMGRVYTNLGLQDEAEPLLEEAYSVRRRILGENHPQVAESLTHLGWLQREKGDVEEARQLLERALAVNLSVYGSEGPQVAQSLDSLGYVVWLGGDFDRAAKLYDRALRLGEAEFGPEHPAVALTLARQGILLIDTGDYQEARTALERALAIREKTLGAEHPDLGWSLHDLGWLNIRTGDHAAAQPLFERALEISEKVYGPEHPNVAWPLEKLGILSRDTGDLEKARAFLERAFEIRERALDSDHVELAWSLESMGELFRRLGDYDRGREFLERSFEVWQSALGPEHPGVAHPIRGLGFLALETGNLDEAENNFRRALEIRENALGPDHPMVWGSLLDYATVLQRLGRKKEAEELSRRAQRILQRRQAKKTGEPAASE